MTAPTLEKRILLLPFQKHFEIPCRNGKGPAHRHSLLATLYAVQPIPPIPDDVDQLNMMVEMCSGPGAAHARVHVVMASQS